MIEGGRGVAPARRDGAFERRVRMLGLAPNISRIHKVNVIALYAVSCASPLE